MRRSMENAENIGLYIPNRGPRSRYTQQGHYLPPARIPSYPPSTVIYTPPATPPTPATITPPETASTGVASQDFGPIGSGRPTRRPTRRDNDDEDDEESTSNNSRRRPNPRS